MAPPDLNLLIALDALLEEGTVVGAARRMNLSAPAMSRTLGRIREALGDPVFVQAGRRLVPTPRALTLRADVRGAVELATRVLTPATAIDLKTVDQCFSVCANDIFVGNYSGRLLDELDRHMPRATLRFAPEEDEMDGEVLRSGRIDLLVGTARCLGPETRVQSLCTMKFVGMAREKHPIFDDEITPQRFVAYRHVDVSLRGKLTGPIDASLAKLGLRRHVALVVPTPYAGVAAAMESDLILPFVEKLARAAIRSGQRVRMFELPILIDKVAIMQAWHPRFQSDPAHRWLRETIRTLSAAPEVE